VRGGCGGRPWLSSGPPIGTSRADALSRGVSYAAVRQGEGEKEPERGSSGPWVSEARLGDRPSSAPPSYTPVRVRSESWLEGSNATAPPGPLMLML
jgi:hypothetical protein